MLNLLFVQEKAEEEDFQETEVEDVDDGKFKRTYLHFMLIILSSEDSPKAENQIQLHIIVGLLDF